MLKSLEFITPPLHEFVAFFQIFTAIIRLLGLAAGNMVDADFKDFCVIAGVFTCHCSEAASQSVNGLLASIFVYMA